VKFVTVSVVIEFLIKYVKLYRRVYLTSPNNHQYYIGDEDLNFFFFGKKENAFMDLLISNTDN